MAKMDAAGFFHVTRSRSAALDAVLVLVPAVVVVRFPLVVSSWDRSSWEENTTLPFIFEFRLSAGTESKLELRIWQASDERSASESESERVSESQGVRAHVTPYLLEGFAVPSLAANEARVSE